MLKAALEEITADGTQYCLAEINDEVGFYQVEEGLPIPAGRGYLSIGGAGIKGFYGFEENGATSIQTIDNGQQTTEGAIYNLAGQRLQKKQKGINIINGKKILF